MNEFVVEGSLPLDEGGTLVIDDGREMLVYVWKGTVWVTQDGDPMDRVLKRGDWLRLDRDGRTVISALAPSAVALTSPNEEHFASRIALAPAGARAAAPIYRGQPRSFSALLNRLARVWAQLTAPAGQLAAS
ncbi:MAG TPA: DUF2917 domain-containing protein [Burkholderiales bacterium]|nr:DUF2917 domain-containing protein [Burkholderiales bacterium]